MNHSKFYGLLIIGLLLGISACGGSVEPSRASIAACSPRFQACLASPTAGELMCLPDGETLSCECHGEITPGNWTSDFCSYVPLFECRANAIELAKNAAEYETYNALVNKCHALHGECVPADPSQWPNGPVVCAVAALAEESELSKG